MNRNQIRILPLVRAGFPSPANDYLEKEIDFNELLKPRPSSIITAEVIGDSMVDAFIPPHSIVVVDRSIRPRNNSIVIATLDGENYIKHLVRSNDGIFLLPANEKYHSLRVTEHMDFSVWGTVTHVIIDVMNPRL
jgi:DNA polymerase V